MLFSKPPFTFDEQVKLLESRGLDILDLDSARAFLSHVNYYRLGGYWLPFEQTHETHKFRTGSSFEDVVALYVFDRELRLLLMDAIERVEVSIRTNWAYCLAHAHGSHAHMKCYLFSVSWQENIKRLTKEVIVSREVFIEHYRKTYSVPQLPPVWSICEIMSLGTLSYWYMSLKPTKTRSLISKPYGLDDAVLQSFLHHLSYLRNLCAHHGRVWNRLMTVTMKLPKSKPFQVATAINTQEPRRLYNSLVMLVWMMEVVSPESTWKTRLLDLILKSEADLTAMGFPSDYRERALWK